MLFLTRLLLILTEASTYWNTNKDSIKIVAVLMSLNFSLPFLFNMVLFLWTSLLTYEFMPGSLKVCLINQYVFNQYWIFIVCSSNGTDAAWSLGWEDRWCMMWLSTCLQKLFQCSFVFKNQVWPQWGVYDFCCIKSKYCGGRFPTVYHFCAQLLPSCWIS